MSDNHTVPLPRQPAQQQPADDIYIRLPLSGTRTAMSSIPVGPHECANSAGVLALCINRTTKTASTRSRSNRCFLPWSPLLLDNFKKAEYIASDQNSQTAVLASLPLCLLVNTMALHSSARYYGRVFTAALILLAYISLATAVDNGLGLTPQMGWNTWNRYGCDVSETLVIRSAQAIKNQGLQALG